MLISLAALGIGIIEAGIMSKQQEIMKNQQQIMSNQQSAAVWPYVQVNTYIKQDGYYQITCAVENKGVGPAIVKNIKLEFNGKYYDAFIDFSNDLKKINGLEKTPFGFNFSKQNKIVLKPGESKELFFVRFERDDIDLVSIAAYSARLQLCYCSIQGDCWRENGKELDEQTTCL